MANEFADLIPEQDSNEFADLIPSKEGVTSAFRTLQAIGQVLPVAEVGAREVSGLIGTSAGGLAGLGTLATNKLGLTDTDPAHVIQSVAETLTYQPKTELGQHLAQSIDYPFMKLAEAGQAVGEKTLDVTGSPALATGAQVGTQLLPLAVVPAGKKGIALFDKPKPVDAPLRPIVERKVAPVEIDQVKAEVFSKRDTAGLEPADRAININLNRLQTSDDVKQAIRETGEVFRAPIDEARRGTITNVQTELLADQLGMTPEKLLSRRRGQAFNAEEALASRKIMVDSAADLSLKAKAAIGGTDEAMLAFQSALERHSAIQQQVSGMTSEAGRALQQFNITVKEQRARGRAIQEILEQQGGRQNIGRVAEKIAELDSPAKLNAFVDQISRAKGSDIFLEAWINGLLSGPQTHAVNITSNALTAVWTLPEQLVAAGIGKLHKGDKVTFRDAAARSYGLVEGFKEGLIAGGRAFLREEPSDLLSKIETAHPKAISAEGLNLTGKAGKTADIAGRTIRIPGRALMGEDEFFKAIGYRMELNQLAMRQALNEGHKGKALAARITDIKRNPPESLQLQSLDAARYQTFTKPLGTAGQSLIRIANTHPTLRLIAPFIRTPTNIIKFAGERTPLALLSKNVRAEINKGGAARDVALAKIATGSAVGATVVSLAAEGLITGGGPSDPSARSLLRASGWQPYSIKVGDEWVSYSRVEPLGVIMGVSADFADIAGELSQGERDDMASRIVSAVTQNVTSKTWLSSMSGLIEMMNDPDRYGKRWLQKYAGTLIPTGVATVARTQDPVLREVETTLDALKARIPGYSQDLPARRNIWGEPIVLQGGVGPDLISPFYRSHQKQDPATDEILRLGITVSFPSKTVQGVKLEPAQYQRYVELSGKLSKQVLDSMVTAPLWETLPDLAKEKFIRSTISDAREQARRQLLAESPAIFNQRIEQLKEAMQ